MTYYEMAKYYFEGARQSSNISTEIKAINTAIIAIEKQIPKKPYFRGDGYYNGNLVYDTWICPNCDSGYEVEFEEHEYCPHCGQSIKWE